MRRFNILFAFAFILLTSCFTDEVDYVGYQPSTKGGIHIVGAVEEYDIKSVGTRADDDGIADSYISEMTMFIFKSNGDIIQGYTSTDYATERTSAINIQRGNPTFLIDTEEGILADLSGGSDTDIVYYDNDDNDANDLDACDIYIVANAWHQLSAPDPNNSGKRYVDTIKTLADLEAFVYQADNTLAMPTVEKDGATQVCGFPMIGKQQGGSFKLKKGDDNEGNAVATIPLKKLYSKVRFTMQINADQVVAGQTPKFTISQVEVFNVPKMARLGRHLEDGELVYDDYLNEMKVTGAYTVSDYYHYAAANNDPFVINKFNKKTISHSTSSTTDDVIEFGFYMPEHKVTPYTIQLPSTMTPEEKEKYAQYYKPTGVGQYRNGDGTISPDKIATFVRIHGSYTDHNGQILGVSYDIYLGQNNYDDFTIKRNQLLNNKLIITGLTNHKYAYNNEDTNGDGEIDENDINISIDHRVEVADRGFNLSMERTAILDAHFEVRPLDIELQPGATMIVTIPEGYRDWIAMEDDAAARSGKNSSLYVNNTNARKGVRKYFTTNLVSELNAPASAGTTGNGGTITFTNNKSETQIFRIWFYVDENPNVYDKTYKSETPDETNGYKISKEQYRVCPVLFSYKGTKVVKDDDTGEDVTVDVTKTETINFQQWNLWRVWNKEGNRFYDIEHEEEYLNNYASDMQYGQTQDGMPWGLDGIQLSNKYKSIVASQEGTSLTSIVAGLYTSITDMADDALGGMIHYDFYLPRDFEDISLTTEQKNSLTIRDYSGITFNKEIATILRASDKPEAKIDGIVLTEDPQSAFAYCYHKNKRNEKGEVVDQKWVLPAIDEIEEIALGAYAEFDKVFQNEKYWSCQPVADKESLKAKLVGKVNWGTTYLLADYYVDNLTRARATSIYITYVNGVETPVNISSKAPGYSAKREGNANGQYGGFLGLELQSFKFDLTRTPILISDEEYAKHPGNLPRTESCRIRAVYRSGTNSGTN